MQIMNIKTQILMPGLLLLAAQIIFSCESKDGACESKIKSADNKYIYSCREANDDTGCSIEQTGVEKFFHEGASCASLGYSYGESNGAWHVSEDDWNTPGTGGVFKNDVGGGLNCEGGYDGPQFDIQIDSQCQTAFVYRCSGAEDAADAACSVYKAWQKDNPSIPNCPYCD